MNRIEKYPTCARSFRFAGTAFRNHPLHASPWARRLTQDSLSERKKHTTRTHNPRGRCATGERHATNTRRQWPVCIRGTARLERARSSVTRERERRLSTTKFSMWRGEEQGRPQPEAMPPEPNVSLLHSSTSFRNTSNVPVMWLPSETGRDDSPPTSPLQHHPYAGWAHHRSRTNCEIAATVTSVHTAAPFSLE